CSSDARQFKATKLMRLPFKRRNLPAIACLLKSGVEYADQKIFAHVVSSVGSARRMYGGAGSVIWTKPPDE
ncbi:MAG: hypothetical protein M3407_00055, partial [Acidobacteriota bacterium]|nr:hypothetical protein [Acidobacteriota bacterium]